MTDVPSEYALAPFDVVLAEDTVVQPDFLFVAADRFEELYDGHGLTGAPDLAAGGDETLALTPFDDLENPLDDIWFEETGTED